MAEAVQLRRRIEQALGHHRAECVLCGGRVYNLVTGDLAAADVALCGDTIVAVGGDLGGATAIDCRGKVIVPGFIDSHVHVESSLVTPAEFARCVLPRGTTCAICDPHEIANVLGIEGILYVLAAADRLPLDLRVLLPSCVPATALETSGSRLGAADLAPLRREPKVLGLAEMMDVAGVLACDPGVLAKLSAFAADHVDGHAPLLRGRSLDAYLATGIRTCHESTSVAEAGEKLAKGMALLMREGGVAKDLRTLAPLLTERTSPFIAFCTDDRTPRDILAEGHIDHVVRTAIAAGVPRLAAYRAASWSAARLFGLRDRGLVAAGWRADLVLLDDFDACAVAGVVAAGRLVRPVLFEGCEIPPAGLDSVRLAAVEAETFAVPAAGPDGPVIGVTPGSLVTDHLTLALPFRRGRRHPDPGQDVQKLAVLCRHGPRSVGRGFVRGFGLKAGALASSVAHDSHNVIVVGVDDRDMATAVNRLIALGGGFVAVRRGNVLAELALPVAGLMAMAPCAEVCRALDGLEAAAAALGCRLPSPFMHLSFLALPVIPHLKLTDKGLVDVGRQELLEDQSTAAMSGNSRQRSPQSMP